MAFYEMLHCNKDKRCRGNLLYQIKDFAMFKTVFTAAAALVVLPVAAHAEDARTFSHEGVDYVYTTEQKGKATVIKGTAAGGVPFRLVVSGNRVTGTYNFHNVNFVVKNGEKLLETAE